MLMQTNIQISNDCHPKLRILSFERIVRIKRESYIYTMETMEKRQFSNAGVSPRLIK